MDLHDVRELLHPASHAELPAHASGDAFLAGGTWLFSEPQAGTLRLVDLTSMAWPPLTRTATGLTIAATCTLAALEAFHAPAEWSASPLITHCCRALLGSFKIRQVATVGGNLCLSLPAGPIAALGTALEATCEIWTPAGPATLACEHFVRGDRRNALGPGDVLRALHIPDTAWRTSAAFRRQSLTALGRSASLVIGTRGPAGFALTVTAATTRPHRFVFDRIPSRAALLARLRDEILDWHDDVHGAPDWRAHITALLATDILDELA